MGHAAFWENLKADYGRENLVKIGVKEQSKVYEGYFSEEEWREITALFESTNVEYVYRNFIAKLGARQADYVTFQYAVTFDSQRGRNVQIRLCYVEMCQGGMAPRGFYAAKYGDEEQLDDYWYIVRY